MAQTHKITLINGDGIGPEVVGSTVKILEATGVKFDWEVCEAGAEVFKRGLPSGVPLETIESIQRNRLVLKGPLETPIGYGEKSANVTLRKIFETYANIRPVKEFPGVATPFSGRGVDMVIVRENVEDLYAGIEYMQTPDAAECLKLITRKGCEKIIRFAFELARSEGRKSLHCATKANIMKLTEGLMKKVFEEVSQDYTDIEPHHIIIDNCAHQLVRFPEKFEVIVSTNMNGDILSDLASGLVGGLGFAPGANIGENIAMFEAVHGSAPKYAGLNVINPIAVLFSGVMMLRYLGEFEAAETIEQAVFVTLGRDRTFTIDVAGEGKKAVSTTEFTDAVIGNFGQKSDQAPPKKYKKITIPKNTMVSGVTERHVSGIDVFTEANELPDVLGKGMEELIKGSNFTLTMIDNRGVKVYPSIGGIPEKADFYRCRFMLTSNDNSDVKQECIMDLLNRINTKYKWTHVEKLHVFNDEQAFSKAQGED
ncbi:MAG: NADP-dependent isocitrate dehydrogenase [Alphaproteobacteria bacterium]|nr:NADP-dependent isocitrate dehydrogenase [Alphaproteobacteria bacterium]